MAFTFIIFLCISYAFNARTNHIAYAEATEPVDIPSSFLSLQLEGDPSVILFEKGKVLYKLKAYREAAELLSQIEKDAPQDMPQDTINESLYLMGVSLMKSGNYLEALSSIEQIQDKSRFYLYGLYTKSMVKLNLGRDREAMEHLEGVIKVSTSLTAKDNQNSIAETILQKAHLTLGFLYLDRNDPPEALKHFAAIPSESPFYMKALYGSGWAYADMGRWVRTVVYWEELAYLYPESKYSRDVMPYIGHSYTTLSAYGKALEQNGVVLKYYDNMLKRLSEIEKDIEGKDIESMTRAIEILGDKELLNKIDLYNGLLYMEEYLMGSGAGVIFEITDLIDTSNKNRRVLIDTIHKRLLQKINDLRQQLLAESINTTLEIGRNLRMEGGGEINIDMIFE